MTLRLRLLAIIGLSFTLLWTAASIWMLLDLRKEFRETLDQRLAASARMVAGLVAQLPPGVPKKGAPPSKAVLDLVARDGVACEISMLRGEVIVRTDNSPERLGAAASGYGTGTYGGERWRSFTLQQGDMRITTADRVDRREALLHDIVLATAVPFLIAAAGSLLTLWFGIRRGLAPLETIRNALSDHTPDVLKPLSEERLPGELKPLVSTINLSLERAHRALERERSFTGSAAHELRTPLTAVKTHIQIARMAEGKDTALALENAEEGVLRLQRTLDQLLTLARVEASFSFGQDEYASAGAIAERAVREVMPVEQSRIRIEGRHVAGKVAVPPLLMITALRNLLDNALRYSPDGTPVLLEIGERASQVSFRISDSGPGMSIEERSRALQRFWRKGNGQGSGLGLSIVEAIVKRYGGELHLSEGYPAGLIAEIRLPAE